MNLGGVGRAFGPAVGRNRGAAPSPTLTFRASGADVSNATAYSVAGLSIGAASERQYVIACIVCRALGSDLALSAITIGGVAATTIASYAGNDSAGGGATTALYVVAAEVPTGTTATVAWIAGLSALRGWAAVYTAQNISSLTALDTDTATQDFVETPAVISVTPTSAPAVAIAVGQTNDGTAGFSAGPTDVVDVVEGSIDCMAGSLELSSVAAASWTVTPTEIAFTHGLAVALR